MRSRRADLALAVLLAALSYIPLFLSRPGMVAADTKQYLYLDPQKLTVGAASMWDPNTGLGTVTHQNIGYLLPMGPYYSLVSWLGIPMWVGQRFWMGSLMLLAGLGAAYCARRLALEGPGRVVTAVAYTLTPYILDYLDRTSAIIMPWAALGWMIGLTAVATRTGRWRHPALFALVVALVGGVNATSILLVLAAPGLWLVHAVFVTGETDGRRAWTTAGRLSLLSVLVSIWWAAGLWAEGRYGINILRVTETVPTVARTSSAAEVLRGLGYWYFYGWDKVQPWTQQSLPYTQSPWLLAVSFTVPAASILVGLVTRWFYRSYSLALVGLGTVVAVGAFPYTDPSIYGSLIKSASAGSTVALAMRSVDRIVPLVVIGLALLMGSGVTALHLRRPSWGLVAGAVSLALVAADLPALWTGGLVAANLSRPSALPGYWTEAAHYLDTTGGSTRVLGLPGEDFGAYSWGVTMDPVPPGLLSRPYVSRQVVPAGSPASADLLQALDEPIQEGTFDPAALAPVARLMSVGQILLQSDLQYERYHLPLPQVLYSQLVPPPAGITGPVTFGPPDPAPQIRYPLDSELRLGIPTGTPQPPALAVLGVTDPRSLARAEPVGAPVVLAGDGFGLVEAAGAGLVGGDRPIVYAASPAGRRLPVGSTLVVTDTNALAGHKWGSLRDDVGQVEQPGVPSLSSDPSEYDLPLFPGQTTADQTVAELSGGVASVQASAYGDSLSYTPENRPVLAFDGNAATAWTFGAHEAVGGTRIVANLAAPVTADRVTLLQVHPSGALERWITRVTLRFDGGHPVTVALGRSSWSGPGQTVHFRARTFSHLELTVDAATGGAGKRYDGLPQVGFREISVPGVAPAVETLRLPTDLLGARSTTHPLDILLQRIRAVEPPRHDPEPDMSRTFVLPSARTFAVAGTAEINAGDSDHLIDEMIGLSPPPAAAASGALVVAANSSTRLDEDRRARADAAVDGNPATAWVAETGPQAGESMSVTLDRPVSFDHLDLQLVNDGRHSLPSRITVSAGGESRTVVLPLPAVGTGRPQGAVSAVPVRFPTLTGTTVRITVDAVRPVRALDYYSTYAGLTDVLPVGIAELGLPGITAPPPPAELPAVCQSGLVAVDGRPVDVAVTGSTAGALAGRQLTVVPCGNSVDGVALGPGRHTLTTSPRLPSGWSIDQLWLSSAAGGAATPLSATVSGPQAQPPVVRLVSSDRTSATLQLTGTGQPSWLVWGQSWSDGWQATMGGHGLGPSYLLDGFANGWRLPAVPAGRTVTIHLGWAPQRVIWASIATSAAALALCLWLAFRPEAGTGRRRRRAAAWPGRPPGAYAPVPASARTLAALDPPAGPHGPVRPLPRRRVTVTAIVGFGLIAALVSRPAIGAVAAAAAAAGVYRWWGRAAVRAAAAAALVALPVYEVAQQVAHRYWPSIDWPADLSAANDIAWLALALVGADLVAGALRSRRRRDVYAGRAMPERE